MGRGRPSKKISSKPSFIRTGRSKSEKIVICVVYKKPTGKKYYLNTFTDYEVDAIITNRKYIPLIPNDYEIIDIGIGKSFIEVYKKQYKIDKITIHD